MITMIWIKSIKLQNQRLKIIPIDYIRRRLPKELHNSEQLTDSNLVARLPE